MYLILIFMLFIIYTTSLKLYFYIMYCVSDVTLIELLFVPLVVVLEVKRQEVYSEYKGK